MAVPSTPAWNLRELLAHLAGAAVDLASGNALEWSLPQWTEAQVRQRATSSRQDVLDDAFASVRRALQLVRGHPHVEVADEWWARAPSADMAERVAVAEEVWADLALRARRTNGEIARLHRAARAQPHREVRWKQLTRALLAADRRVDAIRVVHEARDAFAEHGLGISAELAELEAAALFGSAGPDQLR